MRLLLIRAIVLGMALTLTAPATAQKKTDKDKAASIDGDKLVGKWEAPPVPGVKGAKLPSWEFTKDGTCSLGGPGLKKGERLALNGTYKLDGNKLTVVMSGGGGGPDEKHEYTIKKLTNTELVWVEAKVTTTWKRGK
jgi:uncharacterized protein (TIGR03066 family)